MPELKAVEPVTPTIERAGVFMDRPEPLWLFSRIIPLGELAFIYGPPGSYKSFAAMTLGGAITKGASFAGCPLYGPAGAYLYMAAEGVHGARMRMKALTAEGRFDPDLAYVDTSGVQFTDIRERRNFIAQLRDLPHRPRLLTVDTFARHGLGLDENSSRDSSLWVGSFEHVLQAVEATGLVIHHSGKDVDRGMRGSSALLGAASTVIRADREGEEVTLVCEKQRDHDEFEPLGFRLRRAHGSAILDFIGSSNYLTDDEQAIIAALQNDQTGLVISKVRKADGSEMTNTPKRRAINSLISKHMIYKVRHGMYRLNGVSNDQMTRNDQAVWSYDQKQPTL
ncbi:MAG: AAA family ATPase [Salinibacterium sp.]|nr:MAG: AAA family ATPase [Salinibacterium sp.]